MTDKPEISKTQVLGSLIEISELMKSLGKVAEKYGGVNLSEPYSWYDHIDKEMEPGGAYDKLCKEAYLKYVAKCEAARVKQTP